MSFAVMNPRIQVRYCLGAVRLYQSPLHRAAGEPREIILAITHVIVVFSISVQGLTIGRLVKSATRAGSSRATDGR
ncbi:MAG TPA: hypothetical protein ENK51_06570 [Gammaproteobacteria bacterium]|nr:hypothetical protein [Gammaproteobacteria bacterium]